MRRKLEIDWYYHRAGCTACAKAQAFLDDVEHEVRERVDARRRRIGPSEFGEVVKGADVALVSNGRTVVRYDLRRDHDRGEMLARMVGPTGNLRAPTLKRDRLVVVGFHPDSMREFLKS